MGKITDDVVKHTYIESVTIEGYKRYGVKVEFKRLHPTLNFIAGPGKSDFLEAIFFALGVDNSELQDNEIWFWTSKASVTVVLKTPHGTTSITREIPFAPHQDEQVSSYKIDGIPSNKDEVTAFLNSVQLNVKPPVSQQNFEHGLRADLEKIDSNEREMRKTSLDAVNLYLRESLSLLLPEVSANLQQGDEDKFKAIHLNIARKAKVLDVSNLLKEEREVMMLCLFLAFMRVDGSKLFMIDLSCSIVLEEKLQVIKKTLFPDTQFLLTTQNEETREDAKVFRTRSKETIVLTAVY